MLVTSVLFLSIWLDFDFKIGVIFEEESILYLMPKHRPNCSILTMIAAFYYF